MSIYERITAMCADKGISIRQLEREIGMSNGSSSRWKNGTPNGEALIKLSAYFNVSTDFILGIEEIKKNNSTIAGAALKMMNNPELTSVIEKVVTLNSKQLTTLSLFLDTLLD